MVLIADCSHSGLTAIPPDLPHYTDWLLLSENHISFLNQSAVDVLCLIQISKLDVSQNNIVQISSAFVDTLIENPKLIHLDISTNKLTSLPENLQNLSSLTELQMMNNKLECLCDKLWMKDWLLNNTEIIVDYKTIQCKMDSRKWIPIIHMSEEDMGCHYHFPLWTIASKISVSSNLLLFFLDVRLLSYSYTLLLIPVMVAIGLTITITLVIVARRWNALKFYMFIRFGFRFRDREERQENLEQMDYDAFINYK